MNGAIPIPISGGLRAAAQIKIALMLLGTGAENYVFWGGERVICPLLEYDMKRELDHLGVF